MPPSDRYNNSYITKTADDEFFLAYNEGRDDEARLQGIELGVWSAILDGAACDFCAWANDRIFRVNESHMTPPAHFGCRCLVAYITEDVIEPEEIEEFDPWEDPPSTVFPIGRKSK